LRSVKEQKKKAVQKSTDEIAMMANVHSQDSAVDSEMLDLYSDEFLDNETLADYSSFTDASKCDVEHSVYSAFLSKSS
jgi:hypothetical protein